MKQRLRRPSRPDAGRANGGGWPSWLWVGVLGLVVGGWTGCRPPEQRQATARRELALAELGSAIAREEPRARVLLVGNPFAARRGADEPLREVEAASLRGLRRGLGPAVANVEVAVPALRPEAEADPASVPLPPGVTTPLSFLTAPGAWDRLRAAHSAATVWVSLIGFPADLAETRAWTEPAGPRWALYAPDLRILGGRTELRAAFESGKLLAVVLVRPGAPAEAEPMVAESRAEFDRRYLLVTRDSFADLAAAWPQLFP